MYEGYDSSDSEADSCGTFFFLIRALLMSGSSMASFFLCWMPLPYVCMVRCGRSTVFEYLCKLHTIDNHVLCHATVVSIDGADLVKVEESRRLHVLQLVVLSWRA